GAISFAIALSQLQLTWNPCTGKVVLYHCHPTTCRFSTDFFFNKVVEFKLVVLLVRGTPCTAEECSQREDPLIGLAWIFRVIPFDLTEHLTLPGLATAVDHCVIYHDRIFTFSESEGLNDLDPVSGFKHQRYRQYFHVFTVFGFDCFRICQGISSFFQLIHWTAVTAAVRSIQTDQAR